MQDCCLNKPFRGGLDVDMSNNTLHSGLGTVFNIEENTGIHKKCLILYLTKDQKMLFIQFSSEVGLFNPLTPSLSSSVYILSPTSVTLHLSINLRQRKAALC